MCWAVGKGIPVGLVVGNREANHPPFVKFENAALKIQAL